MSFQRLPGSVDAVARPYWYLLGIGLALVAAAFVFASRSLVIHSRTFFVDARIYFSFRWPAGSS